MDLIILNDGLYHLIPVTKELLGDIKVFTEIDCFLRGVGSVAVMAKGAMAMPHVPK